MLRFQLQFLAALLSLGVTCGALAASSHEPLEDAAVKDAARALVLKGDLRGFDALATVFRQSRERTPSGSWKLGLAYLSITQDLFAPADRRWEKLQEAAGEWLAENPDSPSAVALDARLLRAHAWAWHDTGDRPGDNNPQFRQLLEKARRILDEHPEVKSQDPEWDALRIAIAREQGADTSQILRMAWEALEREGYYYPLHEAVTNKLMPRWGGSRQAVEQYVKMALAHSANQEGTQAYARIYYYIVRSNTDGVPGVEMSEMGVKWALMQQSLAELMQAYPSVFNRDVQRAITCFTGRAAEMRALGRAETANIVPVAWWDTSEWRQACNDLAFEGKFVHGSLQNRARAYLAFLRTFGDIFWQRIRFAAFVAFFVIEGGLKLLAILWSSRATSFAKSAGIACSFNPTDYPRTYAVAASREPNFIRLSLWMLLLGGASTYVLAHGDSPDPLELQIVTAGCVMLAVTGALMLFSRFTARVVLEPDAVAVRALVGGAKINRQDIRGVREYQRGKGSRLIELVPWRPEAAPLRLPPVTYGDGHFRAWFDSLPRLALSGAGDAGVPAPRAASKAR
jgi:hypothetical protein